MCILFNNRHLRGASGISRWFWFKDGGSSRRSRCTQDQSNNTSILAAGLLSVCRFVRWRRLAPARLLILTAARQHFRECRACTSNLHEKSGASFCPEKLLKRRKAGTKSGKLRVPSVCFCTCLLVAEECCLPYQVQKLRFDKEFGMRFSKLAGICFNFLSLRNVVRGFLALPRRCSAILPPKEKSVLDKS